MRDGHGGGTGVGVAEPDLRARRVRGGRQVDAAGVDVPRAGASGIGAPRAGAPGIEAPGIEAADGRTRDRVLALLLDRPATAADLSSRLGLSPAAVRRHLDALLASGAVAVRAPDGSGRPRSRGRPAKVFALTPSGHASFHSAYDDLALAALRFLSEQGGPEAVEAFARVRVAELETRYRAVVDAPTPQERAESLASALSSDGYAATVGPANRPGAVQLCQHHCPVQSVAAAFPQLCDAETAVFARLLGTHVQRLATIAHGDGVCTTHVPAGGPGSAGAAPAPVAWPGPAASRPTAPRPVTPASSARLGRTTS